MNEELTREPASVPRVVLQHGAVRFGKRHGEWFIAAAGRRVALLAPFVRGELRGECKFIVWPKRGVAELAPDALAAARVLARGSIQANWCKCGAWRYFWARSGRLRAEATYVDDVGGRTQLGTVRYYHRDGVTLAARGDVEAARELGRATRRRDAARQAELAPRAMFSFFRADGTLCQRLLLSDWQGGPRSRTCWTPFPMFSAHGLAQMYAVDGVTLLALSENDITRERGDQPLRWRFFRRSDGSLECVTALQLIAPTRFAAVGTQWLYSEAGELQSVTEVSGDTAWTAKAEAWANQRRSLLGALVETDSEGEGDSDPESDDADGSEP
jgi:hypothetical protein